MQDLLGGLRGPLEGGVDRVVAAAGAQLGDEGRAAEVGKEQRVTQVLGSALQGAAAAGGLQLCLCLRGVVEVSSGPQLAGEHGVAFDQREQRQRCIVVVLNRATQPLQIERLVLQRVGDLVGGRDPSGRPELVGLAAHVEGLLLGHVHASDLLAVQLLQQARQVQVGGREPQRHQ